MSRTKRSAMTFLSTTFAALVANVVGFVATPFLLLWLGADRLGAYRVSLDWFGYLALLELGTGAALGPLLLKAKAEGDTERVTATLAAGLRRYCLVAILTLIVGTGLVAALPYITNTPAHLHAELWIGGGLQILVVSLTFPLLLYRSLAEAEQRGYIISSLLTVQSLVIAAVGVAAAYLGAGLIGQFAANVLGWLVIAIGLALFFRRANPIGRLIQPKVDLSEATRQMKSLSRHTLLQLLIGRICLLTDNIIVALFLGPAAVTAFVLTQRLMQLSLTFLHSVGNATWAGLSELYQTGHHDLFRQRMYELTKVTATLAGAFVVPLAALTQPFVRLWVGADQYAGDMVVALALANTVVLPITSLWGWVFNGTGRAHRLLPYLVIQAILNVSISLWATSQFGLAGPLIGTAAVNLTWNIWWMPRLMRVDFGTSRRRLFFAVVVPLVPAAIILAGLVGLRFQWPNYSWLRLALEFMAASGLYLLIAWRWVLAEEEREVYRRLVSRFRRSTAPQGSNRVEGNG